MDASSSAAPTMVTMLNLNTMDSSASAPQTMVGLHAMDAATDGIPTMAGLHTVDASSGAAVRSSAKKQTEAVTRTPECDAEAAQESFQKVLDGLVILADCAVKASAFAGEKARQARPHVERAAAAVGPAAYVAGQKAKAATLFCLECLDSACAQRDGAPQRSMGTAQFGGEGHAAVSGQQEHQPLGASHDLQRVLAVSGMPTTMVGQGMARDMPTTIVGH